MPIKARYQKQSDRTVRIIRDYCVPGTVNVLHARGDVERLPDWIAEALIENGYARPVNEIAKEEVRDAET